MAPTRRPSPHDAQGPTNGEQRTRRLTASVSVRARLSASCELRAAPSLVDRCGHRNACGPRVGGDSATHTNRRGRVDSDDGDGPRDRIALARCTDAGRRARTRVRSTRKESQPDARALSGPRSFSAGERSDQWCIRNAGFWRRIVGRSLRRSRPLVGRRPLLTLLTMRSVPACTRRWPRLPQGPTR
jgi:hypothetical protein